MEEMLEDIQVKKIIRVVDVHDEDTVLDLPTGAPIVHVITDPELMNSLNHNALYSLVLEEVHGCETTTKVRCLVIESNNVLEYAANKPMMFYGSFRNHRINGRICHIYLGNVDTTDELLDKLIPEEDDTEDTPKEDWEKIRDSIKNKQGEAT